MNRRAFLLGTTALAATAALLPAPVTASASAPVTVGVEGGEALMGQVHYELTGPLSVSLYSDRPDMRVWLNGEEWATKVESIGNGHYRITATVA